MGKLKNKQIEDEDRELEELRKKFYDPGPGETDYSEQMTFEQYIKRIGPRKAKGGMVKGFSPIARPQKFKGIF
jgi:hypothetical protein